MDTGPKSRRRGGTQVTNLTAATIAYAATLLIVALLPLTSYIARADATSDDPTVATLTQLQDAAVRNPDTVDLPTGIRRTGTDEGTYLYAPGSDDPTTCWALLIPTDPAATPTIATNDHLCDPAADAPRNTP